jgi:tetratricopeptide (TPR) repeat protein
MTARTKTLGRWLTATLTIASFLTLAAQAIAEDASPSQEAGDEFDAIVARAVEAYGAQRYDEAIENFQRAYALRPQAELIYNIARVYERSVRREEAIEHYQRFLELPNTTAELRARAINSLEALHNELEAMERARQRETPPPPQPLPPPVDEPPNVLGALGWALIGLGGAALATGAVFGGLALSEETATEEANSLADQQLHLDRGENFALAADLLFGIGGALAVTGAILLIVRATRGDADEDEQTQGDQQVSLHLNLGGQGLGLTLDGRF